MSNEIKKEISLVFDKIISKIINYINILEKDNEDTTTNHLILLDKLKSIDNFVEIKLSREINKDILFSQKEKIYLITDINEKYHNFNNDKNSFRFISKESSKNTNCFPSYQYIINKLKREMKEQHEKYKIQELGYLSIISKLQKRLQVYEENKNKNNDSKFKKRKKPKINYSLNTIDNKKLNPFIGKKDKKNNMKYMSYNKIKFDNSRIKNNTIFYHTFSNLKNKIKIKEIDVPNINFNNDDNKLRFKNNNRIEENLFINKILISKNNSRFLKRKINTSIKYDFKDIKKEIDEGKKKILLLKEIQSTQK